MEAIETVLATKPLSREAKAELCGRFERFCWAMANKILKSNLAWDYGSLDDWFQESQIYLISSGERFDPSRGCKFITYATARVWGMLRHQAKMHNGFVRVPVKKLGHVDIPMIEEMRPYELLRNEDVYDVPERQPAEDRIDVGQFLDRLLSSERAVIERRFGFIGGYNQTLAEIGIDLGLSKERVRQIQNQALAKLRERIEHSL